MSVDSSWGKYFSWLRLHELRCDIEEPRRAMHIWLALAYTHRCSSRRALLILCKSRCNARPNLIHALLQENTRRHIKPGQTREPKQDKVFIDAEGRQRHVMSLDDKLVRLSARTNT